MSVDKTERDDIWYEPRYDSGHYVLACSQTNGLRPERAEGQTKLEAAENLVRLYQDLLAWERESG